MRMNKVSKKIISLLFLSLLISGCSTSKITENTKEEYAEFLKYSFDCSSTICDFEISDPIKINIKRQLFLFPEKITYQQWRLKYNNYHGTSIIFEFNNLEDFEEQVFNHLQNVVNNMVINPLLLDSLLKSDEKMYLKVSITRGDTYNFQKLISTSEGLKFVFFKLSDLDKFGLNLNIRLTGINQDAKDLLNDSKREKIENRFKDYFSKYVANFEVKIEE